MEGVGRYDRLGKARRPASNAITSAYAKIWHRALRNKGWRNQHYFYFIGMNNRVVVGLLALADSCPLALAQHAIDSKEKL